LRRMALVGVMAAIYLVGALPALAKGVSSATIEGPGLEEPLVIEATAVRLVEASGFWELLYGADGESPGATGALLSQPPSGDLGPAYEVTWYLGGDPYPAPSTVYPFAPGGPLVYVEEGKVGGFFGIDIVPGGWFAADPILTDLMVGYGVPMATSKLSDSQGSEPVVVSTTPEVAPVVVPEKSSLAVEVLPRSPMPVTGAFDAGSGVLAAGGEPVVVSTAPDVVPQAVPEKPSPAVEVLPRSSMPAAGVLVAGLGVLAAGGGVWALRRRPRRLGAP